jgi:hypothetical protein
VCVCVCVCVCRKGGVSYPGSMSILGKICVPGTGVTPTTDLAPPPMLGIPNSKVETISFPFSSGRGTFSSFHTSAVGLQLCPKPMPTPLGT